MKKIIVFLLCLTMGTSLLFAQDIERNIKERLTDYFAKYTATAKISTPKLNSFDIDYDRRTIQIYASESFAYQPFLPETVKTLPAPMRYPEDCRIGILPSGKVTVIIIRMTKANGDGNAPDYSALQKICSLSLSFFHMSFRCWKMPVP